MPPKRQKQAVYTCDVCQKEYKSNWYYRKHLEGHSGISSRVDFYCEVCDKTFTTGRGLTKHLLSHSVEDSLSQKLPTAIQRKTHTTEEEEALSQDTWSEEALFEEDFTEIPEVSYFELDDELEEERREETAKVPGRAKKEKKTALVKCSECGKSYNTLEGFQKHRKMHAMEDACSRAPSMQIINQECPRLAEETLEEMKAQGINMSVGAAVGTYSSIMLTHVESPHWKNFVLCSAEGLCACFQQGNTFLMPSNLRYAFLRGSLLFIGNKAARDKLTHELQCIETCENSTLNFFLSSFLRRFSQKLLSYFLHYMRTGTDESSARTLYASTEQDTDTTEFRQLMHYIVGSNVKSILRRALRFKNPSQEWKRVISTIRNFFLVSEFASAPDKELMAWTESQDRGGLCKISENALNFFVSLGQLVKNLERIDGSLSLDDVMDNAAYLHIFCI